MTTFAPCCVFERTKSFRSESARSISNHDALIHFALIVIAKEWVRVDQHRRELILVDAAAAEQESAPSDL
jgi:hypothetical protein